MKEKEEQILKNFSVCGGAKLIANIFGEDLAHIYKNLNVPIEQCPQCNKIMQVAGTYIVDTKYYPFCSFQCRKESKYTLIDVACDYCNKIVKRYSSELVYRIGKAGQKNTFCSHSCQAKYYWERVKSIKGG